MCKYVHLSAVNTRSLVQLQLPSYHGDPANIPPRIQMSIRSPNSLSHQCTLEVWTKSFSAQFSNTSKSRHKQQPYLTKSPSPRVVFQNGCHSPPSDLQSPFSSGQSSARRRQPYTTRMPRQEHQTLASSPANVNPSPNAAKSASHDPKGTTSAFQDEREKRYSCWRGARLTPT